MIVFLIFLAIFIILGTTSLIIVLRKGTGAINIDGLGGITAFSFLIVLVLAITISVIQIIEPIEYEKMLNERDSLVEIYEFYQENMGNSIYYDETYAELINDIKDFNNKLMVETVYKDSVFINWFYIDYSGIEEIKIGDINYS